MSNNGKINILLVDDQPSKLLSYEAILSDMGENLIKADSGREALKHLMDNEIAVVLMDACMPEMDGFELASLIREHPRYKKTAIILVSAVYLSDFDRLRAYDSGAVDYVPVPIIPEVLRAKVSIFAELYRKTEALRRLNTELEARVFERTAALESSASHLRENEERLGIALNTGRLGTWELDLGNGEMKGTPLCREHLGVDLEGELKYPQFFASICEGDRQRVQSAVQRAIQNRSEFDAEFPCLRADGSIHWIIARGRPICDDNGTALRVVGVTLDDTPRRRAEEERVTLLDSERAARLEAERAGRAKDEFLAVLSHELRSPLNSILGWVQLLRRGPADPQNMAQGLETIERTAWGQARLIEDLLDVSRVVSGKVRLDRKVVDITATVDAAIETVSMTAKSKKIQVARSFAPGDWRTDGDPVRLQQVISNLLSNAVKFTPTGGHIRVGIQNYGPQIEISVSDSGEGIAAEFLPHVFDRFRQADGSTTRRHGGLGLGLSIAKHLIELHGGSIKVNSPGLGKGSTFSVRLPAMKVATHDQTRLATPSSPSEPCLDGMYIVVVDDDCDAADIMQRLLTEAGAEVRTANSADAALDHLNSRMPDLLVSDIGMPGKDGYELIREVRRIESEMRHVPAIAVTAFARPEDRAHALDAGYDRHICKPVKPNELLDAIVELVPAVNRTVGDPRRATEVA